MGCSGSTTVNENRNQSTQDKEMPENQKNTADSNNKQTADVEEEQAIARFKGHLMAQLQSIANDPPVKPIALVEGDSRMLLIPSLFQCEKSLKELNQTPLPADSNLLITYLKSGTHWLWEIMKMLRKGAATPDGIPKEMGHLEFFPPSTLKEINGKDLLVFATHFPLWTLPKSCYDTRKTVYVIRNPKDVCVSLYYHYVSISEANPTGFPAIPWDQYFEMFLGPSEANLMGNWFDHVADYWDNHRTNPNILCVMFEDMKKDPLKEIKRIDEHIGSNANDKLLQEIVEVSSFNSLKQHKQSSEEHLEIVFKGSMYRKGEIGDWENHLSEEQNKRLEEKIAEWQNERSEPVPLVYG